MADHTSNRLKSDSITKIVKEEVPSLPSPTPMIMRKSSISMRKSATMLLRKSMKSTKLANLILDEEIEETEDETDDEIVSPFPKYPDNTPIGKLLNHWSEPPFGGFHVRGPKYLKDKKKVSSSEYLFPFRGMDLFLTDSCPENVASNSKVFGGRMRDVPTFVINFRLPWGKFLLTMDCYF